MWFELAMCRLPRERCCFVAVFHAGAAACHLVSRGFVGLPRRGLCIRAERYGSRSQRQRCGR